MREEEPGEGPADTIRGHGSILAIEGFFVEVEYTKDSRPRGPKETGWFAKNEVFPPSP